MPIGMGVGAGVAIGVGVGGAVGVGSGVAVGVGSGVAVGSGVGVGLGVGSGDGVGPSVGVGVAPGAGTGGAADDCGLGTTVRTQSAALSLVSIPFPPLPPGRRSTLDPAGGAGATVPSTNGFVASPQPIASSTEPPTTRRATAPPVAANPPL